MSTDFSANSGVFPKHHLPAAGSGLPYRGQDQGTRVQVAGPMMQSTMKTTSPSAVLAHGLPTPAAEMATNAWQTQNLGPAMSAPVTQAPAGQYATAERSPYLRAQAGGQFDQTPVSPSRSPNIHARTPSHLETLSRQNAELQDEVEELRLSRDQTQEACDNMLTELMTTQEALAERDAEVQSLREQLSHQGAAGQGSLSRNDERELRDLRLRCSRLQGDLRQRDEQLRQTQTQSNMHHTMYGNANLNAPNQTQHNRELSDAQTRYMDAENRASHAQHMHQQAQQQADLYEQQLRDWSVAYDGLKASYDGLQRAQSENMHMTRSRADDEAAQQQLAASRAAVDDVKKMRDFYRNNSENVAKKNIEVTELLRKLEDELQAKTREFEQQRSMLEQLQVQVR